MIRIVLLLAALLAAGPAAAQDLLRIAAIVNDEVISARDVERRMEIAIATTGLRDSPENRRRLREQVVRQLVDERLQSQEARRRNVTVSDAEVNQAIAQLEQQNRVPAGRFDDFLARAGIEKEALLSQIRTELAWTKLLRSRLLPTIAISDEEIDAAIERVREAAGQTEDQVAEIYLSVDSPEQDEEVRRLAARLVEQIRGGANFAAVARQFSQGSTAAAGGDIGWVQPGTLPEEVDAALRGLTKGAVSEPIRTVGGYYIVGLRDRRQAAAGNPDDVRVTLKQIVLPAAPGTDEAALARAREIASRVDGCDSVEALAAQSGSRESGSLGTVRLGDLPPAFRGAVAATAVGKATPPLRTERGIHVLAVCERTEEARAAPDREQIRQALINRRGQMLTRRYMRDLRRDATVEFR